MDKITVFLDKYLSPMFNKLGENKYLQAVSGSFFNSLPVIIIGSIFTLIANFPYQPYINFLKSIGLYDTISLVGSSTTDLISLFTVFFVAYNLAKQFQVMEYPAGLLALMAYFILTPHTITVEGVEKPISAIQYGYFGSTSLFVALIVGLLVSRVYIFVIKKGWVLKMPEGVPPMVSNSFTPIIAAGIVATLTIVVAGIFKSTSYGDIHTFITSVVQKPMTQLGSSLGFFIILYMFMNLCWFFGIHGAAVYAAVQPIVNAINFENLTAFQKGLPLPNMYANWVLFLKIGGLGSTLGLCIYMAIKSKSNRYKELGKMALIPSLFNINEPLCYGMPLMLNPMMFIPLVFNPLICGIIAYIAQSTGVVGYTRGLTLPWTTPPLINGFLQGGISVAILQLVCLIICTIMYIPFFRVMDKNAANEEKIN